MRSEIAISDPEMAGHRGECSRSDRQGADKVGRTAQPGRTSMEGGCISPEILVDTIGDAADRYPVRTIVLSTVSSLLFKSNPGFNLD
jgi:hypothetical protein